MNSLKVKVKKLHPDAKLPTYATDGSACFDLYAFGLSWEEDKSVDWTITLYPFDLPIVFETGLIFEIPENHVMLIYSRSGHGFKYDVRLSNCVGVIDSDFRDQPQIKLIRDEVDEGEDNKPLIIKKYDRIAQAMIIPYPKVEFEEVEELTKTGRGLGGLGSTGA